MGDIIERKNYSEQFADYLESQFKSGLYQPGDKIPSENTMSREFGLSRTVIRVAIKMLQAKGYLGVKQGKGTVFLGIPEQAGYDHLVLKYFEAIENQDSLRVRYMVISSIFLPCAEAAMRHCNGGGLAYPRQLVNQLYAAKTPAEVHIIDRNLFSTIAELSRNDFLIFLMQELIYFMDAEERIAFFSVENIQEAADTWSSILDAIENRDLHQVYSAIEQLQNAGYHRLQAAVESYKQ